MKSLPVLASSLVVLHRNRQEIPPLNARVFAPIHRAYVHFVRKTSLMHACGAIIP
jgi:hypothetical protein